MEDITFICPHCEQSLEAPGDMAGDRIECPGCRQQIEIPATTRVPDAGPAKHDGTAGEGQGPSRDPTPEASVIDQFMARRNRDRGGGELAYLLRRLFSGIAYCVVIGGVIVGAVFGYRALVSWRKLAYVTHHAYTHQARIGNFTENDLAEVSVDLSFDNTYRRSLYRTRKHGLYKERGGEISSTTGTYSLDGSEVKCSDGCVYKVEGDALLLLRVEKTDQDPGVVGLKIIQTDATRGAMAEVLQGSPFNFSEPLVFRRESDYGAGR